MKAETFKDTVTYPETCVNAEGYIEEPALHGSPEFTIKHSCNMLLGKKILGMRTHNEVFF